MISISSPYRRDRWLRAGLILMAALAGLILVPVLAVTLLGAGPMVADIGAALTGLAWQPEAGVYGMLAMLGASVAVSVLALGLATPAGILIAVWLQLFAPRALSRPTRTIMELLAGIPSVVYGLWGLMALVPMINRLAPPGASLLAAVLVLALMILPFAVLITDAALSQVPAAQRRACEVMGLSRWGSFVRVYWPLGRTAVLRGIVLQFGRAMGETMAVLMVAGNVVQLPGSLFDPVRTLTANIALEMGYATGQHRSALFLAGLLLLLGTMLMMAAFQRREPVR